jgi:Ser/Thr protein kinase RdoA (MazF antagonist)
LVEPALAAWSTERLARAMPHLIESRRVPCHRDWEPRNWLVDDKHAWLAAIDFEHARPDHRLADLSRLAAYVWPARPDLREAFEAGYAEAWGEAEEAMIAAFAAFEAVQRWVWGHVHEDVELCASARSALIALGAPV